MWLSDLFRMFGNADLIFGNLRCGCLTQHALDAGDSAAFSSIFLASGFSCSQTESTPAPAPITHTVGRHIIAVPLHMTEPVVCLAPIVDGTYWTLEYDN